MDRRVDRRGRRGQGRVEWVVVIAIACFREEGRSGDCWLDCRPTLSFCVPLLPASRLAADDLDGALLGSLQDKNGSPLALFSPDPVRPTTQKMHILAR